MLAPLVHHLGLGHMRKTRFFLLASVLLALPAGAALAQVSQARFQQLDVDHDGEVDAAEYEAGARASFAALDTDHDGFVTLDELRATIDPNTGGIGRDGTARAQLAAMDQNYDNVISEDEFVDFANLKLPSYDKDGDGRLTSRDFGPR
jgi:Ca2+-binding EF-hand superfamily protein